jgi:hypothetical protein
MTCRRVLSSTPLLVRGLETMWGSGKKETYKLELTNKKYKYYKLLESGKQVVGPISTQALVDWRLGEWGDEFIGGVHWCEHDNYSWMGWFLLLLLVFEGPCGWRNLARTRGHYVLAARLCIENALNFDVWIWGRTPELNAVCPEGFEYRFVDAFSLVPIH